MPTPFTLEPLESRRLCDGGVDPTYVFARTAFEKAIGNDAGVMAAVAGPGDRTYLLAERYNGVDNARYGLAPTYVTLAALDSTGKLDPTFSGDGVALSGRQFQTGSALSDKALLRVDSFGRLYVIDNQRVLRFRPDGTPDLQYGDRGSVRLAVRGPVPLLNDAIVTDEGVALLAVRHTTDGITRSEVLAVSDSRQVVAFRRDFDTGVPGRDDDGAFLITSYVGDMKLIRSGDTYGLALTETHAHEEPDVDDETGAPITTSVTDRSSVYVATFGPGFRKISQTSFEPTQPLNGVSVLDLYLSPTSRTALVLTDRETVRLGLRDGTRRRTPLLPPNAWSTFGTWATGAFAPDGGAYLAELNRTYDAKGRITDYQTVRHLRPGGGADAAFGDHGALQIKTGLYGYEGSPEAILFGRRTQSPYLFCMSLGDELALRRLVV